MPHYVYTHVIMCLSSWFIARRTESLLDMVKRSFLPNNMYLWSARFQSLKIEPFSCPRFFPAISIYKSIHTHSGNYIVAVVRTQNLVLQVRRGSVHSYLGSTCCDVWQPIKLIAAAAATVAILLLQIMRWGRYKQSSVGCAKEP